MAEEKRKLPNKNLTTSTFASVRRHVCRNKIFIKKNTCFYLVVILLSIDKMTSILGLSEPLDWNNEPSEVDNPFMSDSESDSNDQIHEVY